MKFLFQIQTLFIGLLLWTLFPKSIIDHADEISFALILIFGVPHGAADAVLHKNFNSNTKNASRKLFILKYVLILSAFLAFWVVAPFKALVIFVIASMYHFGQEFFEEFLNHKSINPLLYLMWGSFILMAPFLIHYPSTTNYVLELTHFTLPQLSEIFCIGLVSGIVTMNFAILLFLRISKKLDIVLFMKTLVLMGSLLVCFVMLPLILGFATYFVIVHSLNSFEHQIQAVAQSNGKKIKGKYLRDILLFSGIVYVGGISLYFITQYLQFDSATIYLLVLVSALTMPHMVLMQEFYAGLRVKK